METEQSYIKILLLIVGSLLTLVVTLISKWFNDKIPEGKELKLLISELDDMSRHCKANLNILECIDLNNGIPSVMHFEKMKVPESSILFSSETYRRVHLEHSVLIYHLKLIVRNVNIELDEAIKYLSKEDCLKGIAQEYLIYLKQKMSYIVSRLNSEKDKLDKRNGLEPDILTIVDDKSVTPNKPIFIIYDRQFSLIPPKPTKQN